MAEYEPLTKPGEYVCYCAKVTEAEMVQALRDGAGDVEEVIIATGAMRNCNCAVNNPKGRCCYKDIVEVVKRYRAAFGD